GVPRLCRSTFALRSGAAGRGQRTCSSNQGMRLEAPASATAPPAATAATFGTRARFVHVHGLALQVLLVECRDRRLCFCAAGHFDEAETFGLSREFVVDHRSRCDLSVRLERFA